MLQEVYKFEKLFQNNLNWFKLLLRRSLSLFPFYNENIPHRLSTEDLETFETPENNNGLHIGSLDVDSLFTTLHLNKLFTLCTKSIYNQNDTAESLSNSEFKKLLSLVTKKI